MTKSRSKTKARDFKEGCVWLVALKLTLIDPCFAASEYNGSFNSDYPNQPNQLRNHPTSRQHPGSHQPAVQMPRYSETEVVNIELIDGITWSKIAAREELREGYL